VRIVKRLLAGLLFILVLGLAVMYVANPVVTTRMLGLPFGGSAGPEERVAGGAEAQVAVAATADRTIDPAALEQAIAYGEETGSHALLVYHDGALQLEHYYPGSDRNTRSATQSMHKSVLALVVGIAVRDGFIASVDDPAARYLPEWDSGGREKITIRQMLQQVSGIGFPTVGFNPVSDFFAINLGDDIAPIVLGQPLEAEPGTRFDYNSINPMALGIILERATGKRYAEYLSEVLWSRIGAADATVVLDSEEKGVTRFFCCLNATARSWLQVGLLHINKGVYAGEQVVPENWMRDVATPSALNPNYGYLTWLGNEYQEKRYYNRKTSTHVDHAEPFAAKDVIYFDGFGGARVYAVPSLGLVIVRTGSLATGWDDAKLPNLVIRGIRRSAR